jgi:tetratricopeptide (TPR) repeat protein
MIDTEGVLQPLADAGSAVRRLRDYESADELREALAEVAAACDRVLRRLVRADPEAPDALRLQALSSTGVAGDEIISHLRRRGAISLELAGMLHELEAVGRRGGGGSVRAVDGDRAVRTVRRLESEVRAFGGSGRDEAVDGEHAAPVPADHVPYTDRPAAAVERLAPARQPVRPSPPPPADEPPDLTGKAQVAAARRRHRRLMFSAGAVFLIGGLAMLISLLVGGDSAQEEAIAAFRAERLGVAESGFQAVLEREPDNVTALLYLGRIYRRQGRLNEAADVLRRAGAQAPQDAGVARELGHLFMDLNRPDAAVPRFRHAVELEPEEHASWIALIQAMRRANDPEAEEWLRRAPAEVRAALTAAPPRAPYGSQ